MPSWNEVLQELQDCKRLDALDFVRRKYLKLLYELTGRNVIAYYSGWFQKPGLGNANICDDDKNGFMATIHKLDRTKGLDLLLHTPGGDLAATESIVNYLRQMFGNDIRAIVPQIAMSAGTMIACSCKEIIMGKQSNIGPIDPQFNGIPVHGVIDEFERALQEIQAKPLTIPIWQVIVGKYHPTFLGECQNAIDWSTKMVKEWLESNMLLDDPERESKAENIVKLLGSHKDTKTHALHIHMDEAKSFGLKITPLEIDGNSVFQDLVLTVHHAFMHTFSNAPTAIRIVENHLGSAMVFNSPLK